ncbi:hypothetical protein ROD_13531 [Citrobacter rodentium ICC168]|uniref:Uncharacterized protein n=1 Tax=Citrobacter rodentium (strain ICC168) TaxID=637910 RepID=D2TGV4_CITRI|nr:hypothetical protein ROD_13531 [Citrobacter rodentium ICC168]
MKKTVNRSSKYIFYFFRQFTPLRKPAYGADLHNKSRYKHSFRKMKCTFHKI